MIESALCPVLVGRDTELAALEDALILARGGHGQLLALGGEAGMGKTRLCQEFKRRAVDAGFTVLWGGCQETDVSLPYLPFMEAIGNHLATIDLAGLREALGASTTELGQLFPVLRPEGAEPAGRGDDASQAKLRLYEAVMTLVGALSGRSGLLLVLEDIHWADASTRELLEYVGRRIRTSPVLVLTSYRRDEIHRLHPLLPLLQGWSRAGQATLVQLEPLTPDGVDRMVSAIFDVATISTEFRDLLHRRTEGNPFVLEEMLKAALDRGDIYRTPGGWERRELHDLAAPVGRGSDHRPCRKARRGFDGDPAHRGGAGPLISAGHGGGGQRAAARGRGAGHRRGRASPAPGTGTRARGALSIPSWPDLGSGVRGHHSAAPAEHPQPRRGPLDGLSIDARGRARTPPQRLARSSADGLKAAGQRIEELHARLLLAEAVRLAGDDDTGVRALEAVLEEAIATGAGRIAILARRSLGREEPAGEAEPPPVPARPPRHATERLVTVLFADLRSYTSTSAGQAPERTVNQLQTLHRLAAREVTLRQGVVDKFAGDAVMATFNVAGTRLDHAAQALEAALTIIQRGAINGLPVGAGAAVGPAVVGELTEGANLSVIGEATNLAARLQAAAAAGEVLISAELHRRTADFLARRGLTAEREELVLKGFADPVEAYRVAVGGLSG